MKEREVSLEHAGARLQGTACIPHAGNGTTVLMLHGSGPVDRNENMRGQRVDVFNTIAKHIACSGVASVRYDKRGCGASTGSFKRTGFHDLVDDGIAWIDWLEDSDFVDASRIVLLGHSEGCLIALHALAKRPQVAGAVLLCPTVDDIESLLMRQAGQIEREIAQAPGFGGWLQRGLVRLLGAPTAGQRRVIHEVRTSTSDTLRQMGQTLPAKWLRELLAVDAQQLFRQVMCPLLLIGGDNDVQCDPGDVERIVKLAPGPVDAHVVPELTHLLRRSPLPATIMGAHTQLAEPLDPRVLELIERWLSKNDPS